MAVRPFFRVTRPYIRVIRPCFKVTMCRFRAIRPCFKVTRPCFKVTRPCFRATGPCFRVTMCRFRATARDRPYYRRGVVVDGVVLQAIGEAQAEDEAFEEGVAGESVCAVYACTRDFSNGIKAGEGRATVGVDHYATHTIVGRWRDREEVSGKVKAILPAYSGDGREAGVHLFSREMTQVKVLAVGPFGEHLAED